MTIEMRRVVLANEREAILEVIEGRTALPQSDDVAAAATIVEDVRKTGDAAVSRYNELHGGGTLDGTLRVPDRSISAATESLDPSLRSALDAAIANVTAAHEAQLPQPVCMEMSPGVTIDRVWTPLQSVGVYVPGGRAAYPSSMIMGVVPAIVADVPRVVVATPAGPNGEVDQTVLAAAGLLGVTEVYAMGGAQAVAALAHGTGSIRRVDKIVGPGGPWVTAAKLAVYGVCGIDLPAGPSEAAIVVDRYANARVAAADVMCQAEHGAESAIALISTDEAKTDEILREIERAVPNMDRSHVIKQALNDVGLVVVARSLDEALTFANDWAPEHLSLHVDAAAEAAARVPNAGSVFVGHWTPEAAGDYATGANHVLPTGGLARAYGPLSTEDFGSWRQVQTLTESGLRSLAPTITTIARAEGLTAHAYSVSVRLEESR